MRKSWRPRRPSRRPSPVRRRREEEARGEARAGAQGRGGEEEGRGEEKGRRKEEGRGKEEGGRKKKAEEKKKKLAEAKRKEEEKKKFDADKIAALLDKTPDKRGAPQSSTPPTKPTDYTGPTAGERQGNDTVLSAREQDLLLSMINSQLAAVRARCRAAAAAPTRPSSTCASACDQDGSLDGEPVVVDRQNTPLYAIAADASMRAIKQCAPFQLPPDKYSSWSTVTWAFDWPVILGLVQR